MRIIKNLRIIIKWIKMRITITIKLIWLERANFNSLRIDYR